MVVQPSGTVTMLFTDIEGSTRLLDRLGQERYREALDLHRRLLRAAFGRYGGYEVDYEGDAFFVAFSRPADAVAAAGEAQQALAQMTWPDGHAIRVRMGIHTGEPLAAPPKYVGLDVHKAARIMAAGHGGQVLVSDATQRLLEGVDTVNLGEHRLKDLLQPEPLYQLRIEGLPSEFPALKTLGNRPTNLPVQPNLLIGRDGDVAQLARLFREESVRLVTLTGSGGTGKTRLALRTAAELLNDFGSGAFFVSLAPLRDTALVLPAIANALGVREVAKEPLFDTLVQYLEQKAMLLVLDNFEQLVEAAVDVASLLRSCQSLKVMVTSRERLRIANEHVYSVSPLDLPRTDDAAELARNDSVTLFVSRARAAAGDFDLDDANRAAVAGICRAVDGLPLAIELAAARVATLPPQALFPRLHQRLKLLTSGPRDAEERHRTLGATIAWSYDLLQEPEQDLFRRLAVFVDGWTLDGAVAVTPTADDELDLLPIVESLVDKNLLRRRLDDSGEPRFWMLETIRDYGLEQLSEAGAEDEVRSLHAEYTLRLAATAAPQLVRHDQRAWFQRLEHELGNLRSALAFFAERAEFGSALELLHATGLYWETRGHVREGLTLLDDALLGAPDVPPGTLARALYTASRLADAEGDTARATLYVEEAIPLAREAHDEWALSFALSMLGAIGSRVAPAEGRRLVEEALAVARRAGDKEALAGALNNLGILAAHSGALEDAIHHCSEALELRREIGHTRQVGNSLHNLGFLLMRQRRYEEARPFLHKSVEVATSLGDNSYAASAMIELAWCAFFEDDVDDAETTFRHALHLAHATANRRDVCEALVGIVGALVRRGRRERAEGILEIVAPLQDRYFGGADLVREYLADDLLEAGITVPTRDADHAASVAALDDLAEAVLEERSFERDTPGVNIG